MFGITTCDTIKKARTWLESHGVRYRFHDYRAEGIDAGRLSDWVGKVGWEKLLNKASTTFRELPDSDKQSLDERKAKALMLANPTMIKRPVLELGDRILVGFKPDAYEQQVRNQDAGGAPVSTGAPLADSSGQARGDEAEPGDA
jgi:arsenate reductase